MSLQINFAPRSARQSPLRLGISAAMLALILAMTWSLTSETEAGLPPHQTLMPSAEEIQHINSAIDELNFPWLALLTSLENSADESLRIIQFDADIRDGRLSLQGEARDSRAVLELPGRLRTNPAVSAARVISQSPAKHGEIRDFPIRFALEVTFRTPAGEQP